MGQVQSFGILNKGSGLRLSGFTRQATSARLAGDVMQVWINSSPPFQSTASAIIFDSTSYMYILDKRNTLTAGRPRPLTSRGMSAWPYRVTTKYSYFILKIISPLIKKTPNISSTCSCRIYQSAIFADNMKCHSAKRFHQLHRLNYYYVIQGQGVNSLRQWDIVASAI